MREMRRNDRYFLTKVRKKQYCAFQNGHDIL